MRGVLFWVGFLALLPQALWVRKTTPRFAKASGDPRGLIVSKPSTNDAAPVQVLGLGDSIIAGVGAPTHTEALVGQVADGLARHLSRSVAWRAHGKIGANAVAISKQAPEALEGITPDVVVISTGVNDLLGLVRIHEWERRLEALVDVIRAQAPNALIVFCGLPPMHVFPSLPWPLRWVLGWRARHLDAVLAETVAPMDRVTVARFDGDVGPEAFSGDGFHPGVVGYRRFGEAMAALVTTHPTQQPS